MSLSRTVSKINGDPPPVYLTPPVKGFPLELSTQGVKKLEWWGYHDGQNSFKTGLAVQTQYRRVTDRQTDGHATTAKTALAHNVERVKTDFGN